MRMTLRFTFVLALVAAPVAFAQTSSDSAGWTTLFNGTDFTGWKVSGTGANVTEAIFKAVLSNLAGLYIFTEWKTGPDDTSVDNITMSPP